MEEMGSVHAVRLHRFHQLRTEAHRRHLGRTHPRHGQQLPRFLPRKRRKGDIRQHGHTARYEHWVQKGHNLILSGKSIGNHQTLPFADTLTVEKLTADSLVLKKGKLTFKYARQCAKADNKCIPAAKPTPAKTASASVKKD